MIRVSKGLASSSKVYDTNPLDVVLKRMVKETNLYELTNNDDMNKLYFDEDSYLSLDDYDEEERQDIEMDIRVICEKVLHNIFNKDITIANGSGYSKGLYKVSWRFWIASIYASKAAQKAYIESVVNPKLQAELEKHDLPPFKFDTAVYSNNQKMRMVNSSKDGEDRPLRLDTTTGSLEDTLITYIPPGAQPLNFKVAAKPVAQQAVAPPATPGKMLPDNEWDFTQRVADLVPLNRIDDRADCLKIIWGLWAHEQSDRMFDLICRICAKSPKYNQSENGRSGAAWVKGVIAQCKHTGVTFGTVVFFAVQADSKAVSTARRECRIFFSDELFTLDLSGFAVERYEDRWVRPYNLNAVDTLIIHSHLGTGKTRQTIGSQKLGVPGVIRGYERVLYISARRSFTYFAHSELAEEGIKFVNYEKASGKLSQHNKLFAQVESLHRLNDDFTPYDLVICDESESLLYQFHSLTTNKQNIIPNHLAFERIISTAFKVIFADAFVSNRTLNVCRRLRRTGKTLYIQNTYQPYKRDAYHCQEVQTGFLKGMPALPEINTRMEAALNAGKKIVGIWGSKSKGESVTSILRQATNKAIKFYSGDSSPEERAELNDTATHWSKLDALNYTSTITIGVSFDADYYDQLFLVGCAGTALPRDTAQALLRVRRIKDNKLTFTSNLRAIKPAVLGLKAIAAELVEKQQKYTELYPGIKWHDPPAWVVENYIFNENERRVSTTEYHRVLERYLILSGYTIHEESNVEQGDWSGMDIYWDDIPTLSDGDATALDQTRELFGMDRWALKKYKFQKIVAADAAETIWNTYIGTSKRATTEPAFWNLWNEYSKTLNKIVEDASKQLYLCQVPAEVERRREIERLCGLFNMSSTQQERTITHDEFVAAIPRIGDTQRLERLFGWRSAATDKTKVSYYAALLNGIWRSWCAAPKVAPQAGLTSINKRRKMVGDKYEWLYDYQFKPNALIWNNLKFSNNVVGKGEDAEVLNHKQDGYTRCLIED